MSKVILCVCARNTYPGDTLSDIGAQYLLRQLFPGDYQFQIRSMDDSRNAPPCDVLVVCGMSWTRPGLAATRQGELLARLVKETSPKLKIALGIGSYYLLSDVPSERDLKQLRDAFKLFDLVVCRDQFCQDVLHSVGAPAVLAQCPSVFAPQAMRIRRRCTSDTLVIFQNGMSRPDDVVVRKLFAQASRVLCITRDCISRAKELCSPQVQLCTSNDPRYIMNMIASHRRLISFSPQAAMTGLSLNVNTTVLALETSILAPLNFGAKPYPALKSFLPNYSVRGIKPIGDFIKGIKEVLKSV